MILQSYSVEGKTKTKGKRELMLNTKVLIKRNKPRQVQKVEVKINATLEKERSAREKKVISKSKIKTKSELLEVFSRSGTSVVRDAVDCFKLMNFYHNQKVENTQVSHFALVERLREHKECP